MSSIRSWKWKAIGVLIIMTYCQALEQDIGEECTNKNGVIGICQHRNKCSNDADIGVMCNSEKSIICCSENISKTRYFNKKEDQSVESRFGFIPNFFHVPELPQNPIPNINFFNYQKPKNPNLLSHVLQSNLNTMQFVEDRPYQNFDQGVVNKPNKKTIISSIRPTNENIHSNNNNQNSNIGNIFDSDQTTRQPQSNYNYPHYETQRPHQNKDYNYNNNYVASSVTHGSNQNQNVNNNQPFYEINTSNNNYNNNYPSTVSQELNQNKNNNKYPSSELQRPNHHQHENTNRPNYETYQQNQNNNFNTNSNNYNPNHQKPQNNYNSENYEHNSQFPNSQMNSNSFTNRPSTSSSVLFPDDLNNDKYHTQLTTTTRKYYNHQNIPNENTKRISELKCEEYSKPLTTTISALPLSIDTSPKPVSIEKCDSKSVGLIVGGTKAELGEFPHMVALGFRGVSENLWNCGGTLISEQFVLTAAHCIHSVLGEPVKVRLGELNLKKNNDGANPIDLTVDEIVVHPDYVSTSKYNDIALIRMDRPIKFNDHIRPACLYNNNNIYSHKVTATGWGSIAYGDRSSDDLLKVDLDVIDNRRCNKLYETESKTNTLNRGIIDSMVCAGVMEGGHDTCLGDSGGPLVIRSEKNTCIFSLIGITSFGKFCATENSPGVYTRVSKFLPWIEQIVWP